MCAFSIFATLWGLVAAADTACETGVQSVGTCMLQKSRATQGVSTVDVEQEFEKENASRLDQAFDATTYWEDQMYIVGQDRTPVYGPNDGQEYDVYWPLDTTPPPGGWLTVIAVRGMNGNVNTFKILCKTLVKTGRLCISVDYQEPDKGAKITDMANDVYAAVNDIIMHASHYNIDTSRIVIIGNSRGGFITKKIMTGNDYDQTKFRAFGLFHGINGEVKTLKYKAPILFISGEDDNTVEYKWTQKLYEQYVEAGYNSSQVQFVSYSNCGHSSRKKAPSFFEKISKWLTQFETSPLPKVGHVDEDSWPQVCKTKCQCSTDIQYEGLNQAECQNKALAAGHQYYQYLYDKQQCSTFAECPEATFPKTDNWEVFWRPWSGTNSTLDSAAEPEPEPETEDEPEPEPEPEEDEEIAAELDAEWQESEEEEGEEIEEEGEETPSTTEYKFCKNECQTQTQDWEKKCGWNKCSECAPCSEAAETTTTIAPEEEPEPEPEPEEDDEIATDLDAEWEESEQEEGEETPSTTEYKFCTTLVPDNSVWTESRCQERCGAADECLSSETACAKYCSEGCRCGI